MSGEPREAARSFPSPIQCCPSNPKALDRACLSRSGQDSRARLSAIALAVALFLLVAFDAMGLAWGWRSLLVVPFFFSSFGAFQSLYKTCPTLASRHERDTPSGVERVMDPEEASRNRNLGRRVLLLSSVTSVAATLVAISVP